MSAALVTAAAIAFAAPDGGGPQTPTALLLRGASDDLRLVNSRAGRAVFDAADLAPGEPAEGTLVIANRGDRPLRADVLAHRSGSRGRASALGPGLRLRIFWIRKNGERRYVYGGRYQGFDRRRLGLWRVGATRRLTVQVKLTDHTPRWGERAGDNRYQGAGSELELVWRARPIG